MFCSQSPGARHHRTLAEVIYQCFDGSATIRSHWGLHGLDSWLSHRCSTELGPGEFGCQVSPWALLSHSSAHFNASAQGFLAEHHCTEMVNRWWITSPVGHWLMLCWQPIHWIMFSDNIFWRNNMYFLRLLIRCRKVRFTKSQDLHPDQSEVKFRQ